MLAASNKFGDLWGIAKANFILGWQCEKNSRNKGRAIIYYLEGLRASKEFRQKETGMVRISLFRNVGNIFLTYADHDQALKYFTSALDLAVELEDDLQQVKNLRAIDDIYKSMGSYDQAIEMYDQGQEANLGLGNKFWELEIRNSKGLALKAAKRYQESLRQFKTNLEMADRYGDEFVHFEFYAIHNIAEVHQEQGHYELAVVGFTEAVDKKEEEAEHIGQNPHSFFISKMNLAKVQFALGDVSTSIETYVELEKFVSTTTDNSRREYLDVYTELATAYEEVENFAAAHLYQKKYGEQLSEFVRRQQEVEKIDKQYNLELILARYNSLVAEQQRNEQIESFAAAGAAGFVLIIISLILFNTYQRYRLRRDLERSIRTIEQTSAH